ncbi:hypothetical protein [Uliginosibacterium sp. TH139]|uniref:hypothetical protein n=1 Tax=Uliginosibacterium sp. TH139 TaxID=2067453 RepID=UPI000C7DF552|nr:hypothetical protein [Uliginosibacterium sp. TH139]PLK47293.1 hypothetical protein C0V76_17880 [Uliginosibacterium sp. TH139]
MQRNLSREAHLWYTITSLEYIDRAFYNLKEAFDVFMSCIERHPFIVDYAPVPRGGERMEHLLETYGNARALLVQGGYDAMLRWGGYLENTPRVFEEGNMSWMDGKAESFMRKLEKAYSICSEFGIAVTNSQMYTSDGYKTHTKDWRICVPEDMGIAGDRIARNHEKDIYLDIYPERPTEIPEYAVDKSISCKTGEIVPWTGVWVPATGMGTAALAFARQGIQIMQPAYEVTFEDPEDGSQAFELVETTWHPVRPTGHMVPLPPPEPDEGEDGDRDRLRCPAGQSCSQTGYWMTPAKEDSRRMFKQGDVMPDLDSNYGATIWQWDVAQE